MCRRTGVTGRWRVTHGNQDVGGSLVRVVKAPSWMVRRARRLSMKRCRPHHGGDHGEARPGVSLVAKQAICLIRALNSGYGG